MRDHRIALGLMPVLLVAVGLGSLHTSKGQRVLQHEYQRVAWQWIVDRETQGVQDPTAAVARLFEYVRANVVPPPGGKPIGDIEPLEILAAGRGWCDQQANVFLQLARTVPLDGRLVFLRDAQQHSPHSIAEVLIDGTWRVVDPFIRVLIVNGQGELVTREELAEHPAFLTDHPDTRLLQAFGPTTDFAAVAALYQHSPVVFNTWQGKRKMWLERCPDPFRRWIVYALQELYLALPSTNAGRSPLQQKLLRARHYALLDRSVTAERLFETVLRQAVDPELREDASFFLGRSHQQQERFEEALSAFYVTLQEGSPQGWAPFAHQAIAEIDDRQGKLVPALEHYRRSGLMTQEPAVARRLKSLLAQSNES